jgi:hypothetical protein
MDFREDAPFFFRRGVAPLNWVSSFSLSRTTDPDRQTAKIHQPALHRKNEPHVGIFWLIDGKPIIDSTPLSESKDYGDFRTYPRSHIDVWEQ